MIKNDYRRALIMLRGLDKGLSGHVRLERRTLLGSMQFSISGITGPGALYAALMTRRSGRWNGSILGMLGRDSRGQAGLFTTFDPRAIDGLALEEYPLIAIISNDGNQCHLAMCGYVNGTAEVNWPDVERAAQGMLSTDDLPMMPSETPMGETIVLGETAPDTECCCDDTIQPMPNPVLLETATAEGGVLTDPNGKPIEIDPQLMPAGLLLDLDISEKWPESIEALRAIFLSEPAFQPFEAPEYVFVRAPLPADQALGHCAVGIKCADRKPVVVSYGIAGTFSLEPPPGLEGYAWQSDGNGNNGWWTVFLDAVTGDEVDP